jgi:hypothetical protein
MADAGNLAEQLYKRARSACLYALREVKREHGDLDVFLLKQILSEKVNSGVYVVEAGETGLFKIGYAKDIQKRLADLQTGCPFKLKLFGTIPGGRDMERTMHILYKPYRTSGEWFSLPFQNFVLQ